MLDAAGHMGRSSVRSVLSPALRWAGGASPAASWERAAGFRRQEKEVERREMASSTSGMGPAVWSSQDVRRPEC